MANWTGSTSGYKFDHAIAQFYNRDDGNAVGFEMRMTKSEYDSLRNYTEKLTKDSAERAREELAAKVRAALPTPAEGK